MSDPEGLVGYVFLDERSTRLWRESRRWWAVRWLRRWSRERRGPAVRRISGAIVSVYGRDHQSISYCYHAEVMSCRSR